LEEHGSSRSTRSSRLARLARQSRTCRVESSQVEFEPKKVLPIFFKFKIWRLFKDMAFSTISRSSRFWSLWRLPSVEPKSFQEQGEQCTVPNNDSIKIFHGTKNRRRNVYNSLVISVQSVKSKCSWIVLLQRCQPLDFITESVGRQQTNNAPIPGHRC